MELNVTPLQFRTATYAVAVNKTVLERKRDYRPGKGGQSTEPPQSPPVAGPSSLLLSSFPPNYPRLPNWAFPLPRNPVSDSLFKWTSPPTL